MSELADTAVKTLTKAPVELSVQEKCYLHVQIHQELIVLLRVTLALIIMRFQTTFSLDNNTVLTSKQSGLSLNKNKY